MQTMIRREAPIQSHAFRLQREALRNGRRLTWCVALSLARAAYAPAILIRNSGPGGPDCRAKSEKTCRCSTHDLLPAGSEGHISQAEARRRLRLALQASGYRPAEGEEGSLDDLSSVRRMDVAIGTNKDLARGWYIRQALLQDPGHPALELYRKGSARAPRDWVSRWAEAAASVDNAGVAPGGQWIALVSSPIWKALSRFDQPYPPFDFGSHMWVKPVKYSTCVELGLIPPDGEDVGEPPLPVEKAAADRSRYRSPNEGVGADTSALDADIASALDDALGVVARRLSSNIVHRTCRMLASQI